MAPALSEHAWTLIIQVGNAPSTDAVEQCRGCGIVRHTYQHIGPSSSSGVVRWFRNGIPAIPTEECP